MKIILFYICAFSILIAGVVYSLAGSEKIAVQLLSIVFMLWGIKSVIDYKDGSEIQLSWYIAPRHASKSQRTLWFGLSVFLVFVAAATFVKVTFDGL